MLFGNLHAVLKSFGSLHDGVFSSGMAFFAYMPQVSRFGTGFCRIVVWVVWLGWSGQCGGLLGAGIGCGALAQ